MEKIIKIIIQNTRIEGKKLLSTFYRCNLLGSDFIAMKFEREKESKKIGGMIISRIKDEKRMLDIHSKCLGCVCVLFWVLLTQWYSLPFVALSFYWISGNMRNTADFSQ